MKAVKNLNFVELNENRKNSIDGATKINFGKEVFTKDFLESKNGGDLFVNFTSIGLRFGAERLENIIRNTYLKEDAENIIDRLNLVLDSIA